MNIKISMTYSVIFVILSLFTSSMALTTCDQDDQKIMQEKFSNCTTKYKTEYNMAVALEEEEVQRLTCRLVENIVETCGEVWRQCQGLEDVRRMKDMHVESLLHKNRGAVVDIEQCDTVRQFRSRHIIYEEGPAGCSDENFTKSQTDFQTCTHSITTSVNDDIQSLNSVKSISSLLCQAISSISSDCVHHLEKCLDAEDVVIMSENHIEQLKLYFVKLAGDKADDHFHLDNCQEQSDNSVIVSKDVRNALEEDFSEEDYNFEASMENEEFQKLHNSSHAINKIAVGALEQHRPRKDRHVIGWRQRDKLSSSWILAGPGVDTSLTSAEFSEAAAANLSLPSPACKDRIGEVVRGRVKVDKYGDSVQATNVEGDHWRIRHDMIKLTLFNLCQWANVPAEMEVFNLFSRLIPQQGLARIESGRQRQGMVPDFRISIPEAGQTRPVLHELKVISFGKTRYKPGCKDRAVDVRARNLHDEYVVKARKADQQYGGVEVGRRGPVESKLLSFGRVKGIVFGNYGEASEATHKLLDTIATSRVRVALPQSAAARRGDSRSEEGEKAVAVTYIRRRVSVAAVKGQSISLLGRLEVLGPGTAAATGRRRWAQVQEHRWRKDRQAMLLSERQGRSILRRGFARLD